MPTPLMAEFDYQIREGFALLWLLSVAGYSAEEDGDYSDAIGRLSDIELVIEAMTEQYEDRTGARLVRVSGRHGERVLHWNDGAVHRYTWRHEVLDMRCHHCKSTDHELYMVTDKLWKASGLDGWACFRCLEKAIGRQLGPADFKAGIPAHGHICGTELRARMGLA